MSIYYFDHAASSWPKPPEVWQAMEQNIKSAAANPGRGSHQMAVDASRVLFDTRRKLARLFHVHNPNDITFTLNTTEALNLAIKGWLKKGQHAICTGVEHNSVRRPLEYLKQVKDVELTYVETDAQGKLDLDRLSQVFRSNTALVVCTHSSNLLGTITPIDKVAEMCRARGVKLLVDAAQTAGTYPIDVEKLGIDMLAFPGHKGLLGPQGTGGLYIHPEIELEPLLHGGTGSQSEAIEQPTVRPDRYEAGTHNTVGIAGLGAGVQYVLNQTVEKIHEHEFAMTQRLMEGLMGIEGVQVLGPGIGETKTGIVSFVMKGIDCAEAAFILDQTYQIAVRAGYHCTPLGHATAGTLETGAVRASMGCFTTPDEVDYFINAIRDIRQHY